MYIKPMAHVFIEHNEGADILHLVIPYFSCCQFVIIMLRLVK